MQADGSNDLSSPAASDEVFELSHRSSLTSSASDPPSVDEAAERVFAALRSGPADAANAATGHDLEIVASWLTRALTRRGFSASDAEEAILEVLAELADQGSTEATVDPARIHTAGDQPPPGAGRPIRNPKAYLFWLARNRAIDTIRRQGRVDPLSAWNDPDAHRGIERFAVGDDAIARLLERQASASSIAEAKRAAVAANDHLAIRVIDMWLKVAQESGEAPSSRELEPLVHASHTSVLQALRRFRKYVEPVR